MDMKEEKAKEIFCDKGCMHITPLLTQAVERIEAMYSQGSDNCITGTPTGFIDLDRMISGLQPANLIIVAACPSVGKTSFAANIAENVALTGKTVAFFSMELSGSMLATRMIGSLGSIDQYRLLTGKLEDEDWSRMTHALGLLNDAPIFIDDIPSRNVQELCSRARQLHRKNHKEGGLGLIVIDYIQLMSSQAGETSKNRSSELSEVTRSLKLLANELNIPVMALSRLDRRLERRDNKRPIMSDLSEAGEIEQDADLILFIYRDDFYYNNTANKGKAEIIVSKHRSGPIGMVPLTFRSEYTRFENFPKPEY